MKVPKQIQKSIIQSAKYNQLATKHDKIVRDWLDTKGLGNEEDCFINRYIDSCEVGYDPDGFIKFLELDGKE